MSAALPLPAASPNAPRPPNAATLPLRPSAQKPSPRGPFASATTSVIPLAAGLPRSRPSPMVYTVPVVLATRTPISFVPVPGFTVGGVAGVAVVDVVGGAVVVGGTVVLGATATDVLGERRWPY